MYQLTSTEVVLRIADQTSFLPGMGSQPAEDYQAWLSEGNEPLAYVPPDFRPAVIAEFKAEREVLLNRMMSIAGRKARSGEAAFASALDWMAEQIIPLDAHPLVTAATDADGMREAFKLAYREVALQALGMAPGMELDPPDQTVALQWKIEIDKVFK